MYICYTDAGFNNKTKTGGYCSFKIYDDKELIHHLENKKLTDIKSSNQAEYVGMYYLLDYILTAGLESKPITIYSDSQLVVKQLNGEWASTLMKFYTDRCKKQLKEIRYYVEVNVIWQSRKVMLKELGH